MLIVAGAESVTSPCVNGSLFSFTTAHAQRVMRLYQCYNNNTLGQMWTKSMPYLFPFIVEYRSVHRRTLERTSVPN